MLNKISILLLLIILSSSMNSYSFVVKDILNRQVKIDNIPNNVAISSSRIFSALEILYGNNVQNKLVAWRNDMIKGAPSMYMFYKNKYPKIINIPLIGSIKSGFNIENFITLKPKPDVFIVDLYAILGSDYNKLFKYLEKVGIPCIVIDFRVNPIKNTIQSMVILGDALKKKNKAKLFSKIYTQHLNYVVNKINNNNIQRQKVFIERGAGYSNAVALRSFGNENMGSFINLLHGRNIANYLTKNVISQGEITQETVMISNPDIYIFQSADKQNESGIPLGFLPYTCLEEIKKASNNLLNKKWLQLLTAYENKKVYTIYMPLFNSPYNIVAIEYFAKWMYPDLFEKLSPHKTINEIYTSLLNTKAPNVLWGINNFTYKEK